MPPCVICIMVFLPCLCSPWVESPISLGVRALKDSGNRARLGAWLMWGLTVSGWLPMQNSDQLYPKTGLEAVSVASHTTGMNP